MSIKVGDWVRHADRTRNGVSGEVKRVMAIDDDGYVLVFDNHGQRWRRDKCVLCHPPRDKKPRKTEGVKYLRDHFNGQHGGFNCNGLAAEFDAVRAEVRREALKEAAAICQAHAATLLREGWPGRQAAVAADLMAAIRALKEKTP